MNKVSFNSSVQVHELELVCVCERERERERGGRGHMVCHVTSQVTSAAFVCTS